MRAQEFESLKHAGEIEEARMGASDFDAAVAQGTARGVLVGFEFEVLMPKATIDTAAQATQQSITAEQVSELFSQKDIFSQNNDFKELTPAVFDQLFKLKPGTQAKYPNAVQAYNDYRLQLIERVKEFFNKIPEKVRAKYIPIVKREVSSKIADSLDKQLAFAENLGLRIYYGPDKSSQLDGFRLLQSSYKDWEDLFKLWLGWGDHYVARNLHVLFDFDPAVVFNKFKDYQEDEEDRWDDDERDYNYPGAAKALQPAVAQYFGRPVHVFDRYHEKKKNLTDWYIEPDGSLKPNNTGDGAAEIVSPPLSAAQALDALKNFYAMSRQMNLYTNSSTGLHINVSIPEQIDVLKLALFLGDQYVLQQFGRQDSEYAKSSQRRIAQDAPGQINKKGEIKLKALQKIAQDATGFHTASISNSGKYISFRHAGGDYLADYAKIVNTVGRFVRAMLIAADPNAYANEYKAKLAKITQEPKVSSQDYIMNIRTNGLPIYTISIWKLMGSVHVRTIVTSLQFPWQKSNLSMYSIQDVEMNSEQAKQNLLNNLRNPKLKDKATQTPVDKFILINLVPNSLEAIQDIMNTVERGVQIADNRGYNALGYALVRKTVLPPNHPIAQNGLKTILRKQLGKK